MAEVVDIEEQRMQRRPAFGEPVVTRCRFHFDLGSPFSYLAAERVEAVFGAVEWVPAGHSRLRRMQAMRFGDLEAVMRRAERRAAALRLGLVWPDRWPHAVPRAMRASAHAVDSGRGAAFVLAAARLAFCGGYDLQDFDTLAEAAAAAGLDPADVLHAAADERLDARIEAAGRRIAGRGADSLPAIEVDGRLHCGEEGLEDAAALRAAFAAD